MPRDAICGLASLRSAMFVIIVTDLTFGLVGFGMLRHMWKNEFHIASIVIKALVNSITLIIALVALKPLVQKHLGI